jgi:glutamate synthase (NADPH/NADH) small chain
MPDAMLSRVKGALLEADRCLQCWDPPCNKGCPAGIDVCRFIRQLSKGDVVGAAETIENDNPFGLICGWICPSEVLCQNDCTSRKLGRAIDIKALQRYATEKSRLLGKRNHFLHRPTLADQHINIQRELRRETVTAVERPDKRIAVIGGGPSGLTCALTLQKIGYGVVLFENSSGIGGRLSRGIPGFRLDPAVLAKELASLAEALSIRCGREFGRDFQLEDLHREGYSAVFVATGKWKESVADIPGNHLQGVYTADQILTQTAWETGSHQRAAVIGAGNAAMDVARTLQDKGLEMVHVLYRRTPKELTSWAEEREETWQAGVVFHLLSMPVALEGDDAGQVRKIRCARTEPGSLDDSGRRSFQATEGWNFELPVDMVVFAFGAATDCSVFRSQGIQVTPDGYIRVDDRLSTNLEGVFAGGDVLGEGRGTVVQAVADGKRAALHIHQYLLGKRG